MRDEGAIYHFNQLAQEELEHARTFYAVYPDNDLPEFAELVQNLPNEKATLKVIDQHLVARLTEQQALQLAIKLETAVADRLQKMLGQIQSPAARAAIEKNIESTLGHQELIEQDYRRLFR
jgi:rubrerythrin